MVNVSNVMEPAKWSGTIYVSVINANEKVRYVSRFASSLPSPITSRIVRRMKTNE